MLPLWAWDSGATTLEKLATLPAGTDVLVQDGLPVIGFSNMLRAHIDSLTTAPERWCAASYQSLGLDELRIGDTGHSASDWTWRVDDLRTRSAALGAPLHDVTLAWGALWHIEPPEIVATLTALAPHVDTFAAEVYLDADNLGRTWLRAQQLVDASVSAGVLERTVLLLNLSDRPDLTENGLRREYAALGLYSAAGAAPWLSAARALLSYALDRGQIAGVGFWGISYTSPLSRGLWLAALIDCGIFRLKPPG